MPAPSTDSPTRAINDVDIANNALAMLGSPPIGGFAEDSELAGAVNSVYVDVIESCLGAHLWTWTLHTAPLQLLAETPVTGWRFAFALPNDRLTIPTRVARSADSRNILRDFWIEGENLYANCSPLWAGYRRKPAVSFWPAPFRLFSTRALAAELAIPVSQDANFAATLLDQAWGTQQEGRRGGLFSKAMTQDLSHPVSTSPLWARDPLTDEWVS